MYNNRFILVLALLSLLLVGMVTTQSRSLVSSATGQAASDVYQRHPGWTRAVNNQNAINPATGASAFPDYFQRHPESSVPLILGLGASDYFQRHPELSNPVENSIDTTDYFFRHLDTNAALNVPFSAEQIRREYLLGERYGVTPEVDAAQQVFREYWLGERYGQRP